MDNPQKNRILIIISLVVIVTGLTAIAGWLFNVPLIQNVIPGSITAKIICFSLVCLMLVWNRVNWINSSHKQRIEAEADLKRMNIELEKRVENRSAAVFKTEAKYRSLIEQASDAIYVLSFENDFIDVNDRMCEMTGYTRDELLQLNIRAILDPEELKTDPLLTSIAGTSIIRERRFVRKDGSIFNVEINVKMFSDDRIFVIARDITDRKKMEAELIEAELKFRTIAEKSMVGVYIVQNGVFTYVNPRFAEIFGYDASELLDDPDAAAKIFHESHVDAVRDSVKRRMEGEMESLRYEAMGKRKDGTANWVEVYGNRVMFGGAPAIIGSLLDITERKQSADLILKEKALSDSIINSLPGMFYLFNEKRELLRWNKNFEILTGYQADEIRNIPATEMVAIEDRENVDQAIQKAFTDGFASVEAHSLNKDGSKTPLFYSGAALIYQDERCVLGLGIDISLRLKAEEELQLSEQKYKLLFESNPLPLWMIDKDDLSIITGNDAAARLYGYTKDELLNMNVSQLRLPEDTEEQFERYKKEVTRSSDMGIVRHLKKDGSIMQVQVIAHDIILEGRPVRLSLTHDVTEKLIAEEQLKKSEANLQTILKTTDIAYALFDLDLNVLEFNQKAIEFVKQQYYHLPQKGDRLMDFFPIDRFPQFINFTRTVLKGNTINYEIDYPEDNGPTLWYAVSLFPITNDSKEILGLMMALYDISERKNAEQDLKNAYSRIQNQINSIKEMAWKQSHLIRSPLANLKGLAAMLQDDPADADVLNFVQSELDRMDSIIIDMADDVSAYDIN